MDFLFSIPYLPYIVGVLVVVFLYQRFAPRLSVRVPTPGVDKEDILSKFLGPSYAEGKVQKKVSAFKKHGDYLAAGRLLEEQGKLAEAAECYLEGQELHAAASMYEKLNKLERAAELYLQDGDHKKAGEVLIAAKKPGKAAQLFMEKGNTLDAARLFGVAGQWDKAGDLYAKGGYPLRAAEAYEKNSDWAKAAESFEKHFMENVSFSTAYSATGPSKDQQSAQQAGRLWEKAGDLNRALQIFTRGGYFKDAAAACMRLGQSGTAAELFLRVEDPAHAAAAYEKDGDRVKAANLRGEVALKEERLDQAAAYFQAGQDYQRAAELFESIGMLSQAAGAYEAAESWAAAGGVYMRAGVKDRAAASYEKAGDFETAAKLYDELGRAMDATRLHEKAGDLFRAGHAAAQAGLVDRAIALLQRVTPTDDDYRGATETLARLFLETGRTQLAVERLQKVIAGQPASALTIDLYYWLALAQETARPEEALSLFKQIQSESLDYKDVDARIARLERVVAGESVPPLPRPTLARAVVVPPPAAPAPVAPAPAPVAAAPAPRPPAAPAAPAPAPAAAAAPAPAPAAAPPAAAKPGAPKPPRFHPKEELGRGRLGVVFRAEDQIDGRSVALRVLPDTVVRGDGVLAGLAADLKAAAALSHPNGVKVLGFVERDGQRCVVTEYVQGRTLGEAIKSGHKMSVQQAHALGRVLAGYLSFVHAKGLVHGSIQPSNVMVSTGVLKIADLGLGRLAHALPADPDYRAPENRMDVPGDLYAMAAVLYHLLTGVHPRTQPQGTGLPLPSTFTTGVPEALDKLLVRCLHPRVDLRMPSADAILQELKVMVRLA